MTVAELIAELGKLPPELPVYVEGYEWGLEDMDWVRVVDVARNVLGAAYGGSHAGPDDIPRVGATYQPGVYLSHLVKATK